MEALYKLSFCYSVMKAPFNNKPSIWATMVTFNFVTLMPITKVFFLGARAAVTTSIVYFVVVLIISILLVVGAVKSKPALLVPYVVLSVIGMILLVVMAIVLLVLITEPSAGGLVALGRVILACTVIACLPLPIYFCLVVVGLYKQQKAENQSNKGQSYQANA